MHGFLTVYKASAGSGKTFTLAAEYIAMIIGNPEDNHRNVLVVTFTNKATAEMKQRVLKELWDMGYKAGYSASDFFQTVARKCPGVDNRQICERAKAALHAILHDYDYFHVKTIDAFFQSLLTSLAHELGLSAGAGVEIDDKRVIEQAVDNLLHTVSTRGNIASWLLGYVNEKIMEGKVWNVSDEVKRLAKQATQEIFLANEDALLQMYDKEDIIAEYRDLLLLCQKNAHQNAVNLAGYALEYAESVGGFQLFSNGKNALSRLQNIMSGDASLPTVAYAEKLSDHTKWIKTADKKKGNLQVEAQKLNEWLNRVEDAYKEDLFVSNSVKLTLKYINPLRLMGEISRDVAKINSENNRFLLAKTPLLFNKLVGADDASFVFERVGTTFSHIMIDEFQDTSSLQWVNFKRLLVENMSAGNTCMLVGDVKQSIYRFRGGDWKILNGIENEMKRFGVESKTLNTNYRSHSNVILFNNTVFSAAAHWLASGHGETLERIYADVVQQCNQRKGGYAEFSCMVAAGSKKKKQVATAGVAGTGNGGEEQEDVLALLYGKIEALQACGVLPSQMAILVRYNGEARQLVEAFSDRFPDVPLVSDEAFWLSSSRAVNLIVCVMRYCLDHDDEVALTYIYRLIEGGEHEAVSPSALGPVCKEDMLERMPRDLIGIFEETRHTPLLELCEHVIDVFKLNSWEGEAPYLLAFLDGVMEYLDGGKSDLKSFMTYWDESMKKKPIPSCDKLGVRVLTIHKSKGLAFPAVFLPYLHWAVEKDRNDDIMWVVPKEAPYNCLSVIPSSPTSKMKNSIYADAYEAEHFDRRVENLNLAYVAFTRAEEFLYIWAKVREDVSVSQHDLTIGEALYQASKDRFSGTDGREKYVCGVPPRLGNDARVVSVSPVAEGASSSNPLKISNATKSFQMNSFPLSATFKQSNSAADFVSDDSDALQNGYIDKGKVIHYLFSKIRYAEDVSSALLNVQAQGLIAGEGHFEELKNFVKDRLEKSEAREWFTRQWRVYNECSILVRDKDGNLKTHRPDRVITDGETTLVIDYKCGKKKEDHKRQVNEYCDFLRSMGHKNVKGFLWYLYHDEVVPSKEENRLSEES